MTETNTRQRHSLPRSELERRWALVRAEMSAAGIDALIVQGANNLTGTAGHYRWLSGVSVASSYPQALIIPREGPFTLVMHGDFGGDAPLEDKDPAFPGVARRLTSPSFPGCHYCGPYDAKLAAEEIRRSGYKTLGVVAPNTMYAGFYKVLLEELGHPSLVDLTPRIDVHKAVKSEAEIALIRQAAALQDSILAEIRHHIAPGKKDYEIMAYGHYLGQLGGSETGYMLGSSAPPGEPTSIRRSGEHGRQMNEGDVLYFQCENTGPGGYFVHAGRYYVLGKASQQLQDAYGAMVEAQDFTASLLQPGASCVEIFAEYNAYMEARGFPPERRLHCHGQGYDNVEPPLVRQDETLRLAPNMNLGIHPTISRKDMLVMACDNYLLRADGGAERLHRMPREIIEIT
ncbi:MAG TPA: M24 family metallopeptidase [Ramlibacter sp.]|nr:M24 family metallopeptidase [Ramlibacter sp.]